MGTATPAGTPGGLTGHGGSGARSARTASTTNAGSERPGPYKVTYREQPRCGLLPVARNELRQSQVRDLHRLSFGVSQDAPARPAHGCLSGLLAAVGGVSGHPGGSARLAPGGPFLRGIGEAVRRNPRPVPGVNAYEPDRNRVANIAEGAETAEDRDHPLATLPPVGAASGGAGRSASSPPPPRAAPQHHRLARHPPAQHPSLERPPPARHPGLARPPPARHHGLERRLQPAPAAREGRGTGLRPRPWQPCQWQPEAARSWQLKTAHFGRGRFGLSGRSRGEVHRACWAGGRERSDRSYAAPRPETSIGSGPVAVSPPQSTGETRTAAHRCPRRSLRGVAPGALLPSLRR